MTRSETTGWQLWATAPPDNSHILCTWTHSWPSIEVMQFTGDRLFNVNSGNYTRADAMPTHWRLMPEPPPGVAMPDLAGRLRSYAWDEPMESLMKEAADEIERLRAEVAILRRQVILSAAIITKRDGR